MHKRILTILLTITILIQIAVPLSMIIHKTIELKTVKEKGALYTFSAFLPDLYDNKLSAKIWTTGASKQYVIINTDENGKIVYTNSDEEPDVSNYINRYADSYKTKDFGVSFPEVYITTDNYDNLQNINFNKKFSLNNHTQETNGNAVFFDEVTVDAYVYNGKIYIEDIYIDGIASETYLKQLNEKMK